MMDKKQLNFALASLALGGTGLGTTEFVMMGILPQIAQSLHISIPQAGNIISSYALGVVIGAPFFAVLTARWDRKTALIMLMVLFTAGNLATAWAQNYSTMLFIRFLSGLPHGAFFGIAGVSAAILADKERRGHAVSMVLMGLGIANVLTVPALTLFAHFYSWHEVFIIVACIGALTLLALSLKLPSIPVTSPASLTQELAVFKNPRILLTLLFGMIGFSGLFAFYSYIAPTMIEVAGFQPPSMTWILCIFGVGMLCGNYLGGKAADKNIEKGIYLFASLMALALLTFSVVAAHQALALIFTFIIATVGQAYNPILQTRLMTTARQAQNLAGSLNHSAINIANALGAYTGGLAISYGFGYPAASVVGAGLTIAGIFLAFVTFSLEKKRII